MHKLKISLYTDSAKFHDENAAPWEICGNAPAIIYLRRQQGGAF